MQKQILVSRTDDTCLSDGMPEAVVSLARRMKWALTEHDRAIFLGCKTLKEVMARLTESELMRRLFWSGNMTAQGRLGEFYVTLLTNGHWDPQPGYDVHTSVRLPGTSLVEIARVEVRTRSISRYQWTPSITGETRKIAYDVLVVIGFNNHSLNPCNANLFAIPCSVLKDRADGKEYGVKLAINVNRINTRSGKLNKYWKYWIPNHCELRDAITNYAHGEVFIAGQYGQLDFFYYTE